MRDALPGYVQAKNQSDLDKLYESDKVTNRKLYDQVPAADRYEVIGPDGNGVAPAAHDHGHDLHERIEQLEATIAELAAARGGKSKAAKAGAAITPSHSKGKKSKEGEVVPAQKPATRHSPHLH